MLRGLNVDAHFGKGAIIGRNPIIWEGIKKKN